jgi:hypothetical protein
VDVVLVLEVGLLPEFALRPLQFFRALAKAQTFGVLPCCGTFPDGVSDRRGRFGGWTIANRLEHTKDARVCLRIDGFHKLKPSEQVFDEWIISRRFVLHDCPVRWVMPTKSRR